MDNASTTRDYDAWIGRDAYGKDGDKIGSITDIYYDDATGRPEWVAIKSGLFGSKHTLVPIHRSVPFGDDKCDLQVAWDAATIKDAPMVESEGHMSPGEERQLWEHYDYDYSKRDYGRAAAGDRADKDYTFSRWSQDNGTWGDRRRLEEHVEEVPVQATAQVSVPVDTTVRLRRYQTQSTKQVTVPVTETEEHVEVADVDTKPGTGSMKAQR